MAVASIAPILRHIRKLVGVESTVPLRDQELVRCFAAEQDEAAFAELVERHATLVHGVCQRVLGHVQDAEDAFQATFLVLALRCAAIRKGESLASWLHGVAYRVATKSRVASAVRQQHECRAAPPVPADAADDLSWREVRQVLDEELQRLPAEYREPLLRCYLQGKTQDEAARELGWLPGTLRGRLDRGRERLRRRLTQRGITLSAALAATLVADSVGRAAVPAALRIKALKAALGFMAGSAEPSLQVMALTNALLQTTERTKGQTALWLGFVAGALAAGAAGLAYQAPPAPSQGAGCEEWVGEADEPQTRNDLYGDPLPEGALVRLGTLRFRPQNGGAVRFVPGGRVLALSGWQGAVSLVDRASGKEQKISLGGKRENTSLTANCEVAVGYSWEKTGPQRDVSTIRLWEVSTGKLLRSIEVKDPNNFIYSLAISPDGAKLAAQGTKPVIRLLDANTGKELWQIAGAQGSGGQYCLAFSPDSRTLVGPGEKDMLCLWDVATGNKLREICRCAHAAAAVFSADGKTLAAATRLQGQGEKTAVRLWDLATGKELPRPQQQPGAAFRVALTADGQTLAAAYTANALWGPWDIGLWEVATGKKLRQVRGGEYMAFSPDGTTLASSFGMVFLHDVATGKELNRAFVGHQGYLWSVAFSRDGKTVVTEDRHHVQRIWDPVSGKQVDEATSRLTRGNCWTHSADGKLLAWTERDFDTTIHLGDAASGKELRIIDASSKRTSSLWAFALSPDGKVLAGGGRSPSPMGARTMVRLWDVDMGKELPLANEPSGEGNGCNRVCFSPDGKFLALGCSDGTVRLWEIATGKEFRTFCETPARQSEYGIVALAFSRDGKTLVATSDDGKGHMWEVATGKERRLLVEGGTCYGFSADGRYLVAGLGLHALVWDITGAQQPGARRAPPLADKDLASLWADLVGDDARTAYRAIGLLSVPEAQSVPYLRERLQPASFDERRTAHWIADLDSEQFAVRERAVQELEQLGELAESALRRQLTLKPSLEVKRRLEALLEKLERGLLSGERLRACRAVEALEALGTPEAKQLLEALVKGAEGARLTREARAALERLAQRSAAMP
jgi:RNA polymerase sigma factor (sigma-70 family)